MPLTCCLDQEGRRLLSLSIVREVKTEEERRRKGT
jgi:hypothetical protein